MACKVCGSTLIQRCSNFVANVIIAAGESESSAVEMTPYSMMYVQMPAAWTAASIGFMVSYNNDPTAANWQPLYAADGTLVQIASPAVDQAYVAPAELAAVRYFKLLSQDGAGTPVAQVAEATLVVSVKA